MKWANVTKPNPENCKNCSSKCACAYWLTSVRRLAVVKNRVTAPTLYTRS